MLGLHATPPLTFLSLRSAAVAHGTVHELNIHIQGLK